MKKIQKSGQLFFKTSPKTTNFSRLLWFSLETDVQLANQGISFVAWRVLVHSRLTHAATRQCGSCGH